MSGCVVVCATFPQYVVDERSSFVLRLRTVLSWCRRGAASTPLLTGGGSESNVEQANDDQTNHRSAQHVHRQHGSDASNDSRARRGGRRRLVERRVESAVRCSAGDESGELRAGCCLAASCWLRDSDIPKCKQPTRAQTVGPPEQKSYEASGIDSATAENEYDMTWVVVVDAYLCSVPPVTVTPSAPCCSRLLPSAPPTLAVWTTSQLSSRC